jgi:carbonic anhydrase
MDCRSSRRAYAGWVHGERPARATVRINAASVAVLIACFVLASATTATGQTTQNAQSQAAMTPDQALRFLQEGNARFVAGMTLRRDLLAQVRDTSAGQYPFAAVLGCSDSRVAPELIFDTGIGDLFVARIAGNAVDEELLGSLEFATKVAGARLIVVLGHTHCGAVMAACDGVQMGSLTRTLALLEPAVAAARKVAPGKHNSSNPAFVAQVTEFNVRLGARVLVERSPIIADLVREGRLRVVPAIYDVASGRVEFLAP